jgi:RNA polymerase sigma-70 factor, ECF subfamily
LDSMTDEQLVALTQQGNMRAFNRLSARWESSIYRFALRNLGNTEDARDVCQEALLKAFTNIQRLREGSKFKPWVHHIALNLCRDRFRSARAKAETRSFEEHGIDEARIAMEQSRVDQPERAGLMRAVEEALGRLPMEQRSAILLKEYHGFTSEEIGEITGVPAATVRSRIFYGLKTTRKMLRDRGFAQSAL